MGGMSFKCPHCDYWALAKQVMKYHAETVHDIEVAEITGTGLLTDIKEREYVSMPFDMLTRQQRKWLANKQRREKAPDVPPLRLRDDGDRERTDIVTFCTQLTR